MKMSVSTMSRHCSSAAPATQEQALDRIIELSIFNDNLQELFNELALETIRLFQEDPYIWCNLNASFQNTSRRALRVLSDSANYKISYLIDSILSRSVDSSTRDYLLAELEQYFLCVLLYLIRLSLILTPFLETLNISSL